MNIDLHPVNSRRIAQIGYDEESRTLAVEFQGNALYHYPGVSRETYTALDRAPSKGDYFETAIRDRYKTVKVSPLKTFTGFSANGLGIVTITTEYRGAPTQSSTLAHGLKEAPFSWGNGGPGAMSLANAILAATIGRKRSASLAPAFAERVIAHLPAESWTLTETAVREEVEAIDEAATA